MSDITIRLDGLIFCLIVIASGAVLTLLALGFAAHARWGSGDRQRSARIARACTLGVGACLLTFAALVVYLNSVSTPVTGPDWTDWAALPWCLILIGVLVRLARSPAR
ncbi:hypothetical protein [Sphingobium nicotianae]|uniref:Uncharacterized protein n=1 Tax=Sphingobium nicotianae TaxID=2782607 RepID=A0A9X1DG17_9SPHN|nr:hypothetical protein [Sphingobium nicotianae]MBT2189216.1 hypothetical protein [Sphingobium nicotianae]